ncbi:MAG: quaternary amine ABC transporter ATP-binding protein [Methyloligellaceae bacterium]
MTEDVKISVRALYKIFGSDPETALDLVRRGADKQTLMEKNGHVLALANINIDIPASQIFVVMGLSGSGKSTLIRHFNRIIEPTAGQIKIGGRDILSVDENELRNVRRHQISMVFQKFALLPHRTAIDNVAYGLTIQGLPASEARSSAKRWIERVGMTGSEDYYPSQLSGGMQQRIGLARALATDADILLMDEAFSALDPLIRTDMQDMLLGLQADLKKTIVFITHDLEEALKLGDGVAILRDGELVQQGDPQSIVLKPTDGYVEDFVKTINRGRVIRIGSIMAPPNGRPPELALTDDTVLEDALVTLTQKKAQSARVVNAVGEDVGHIELNEVVKAIAIPAVAADNKNVWSEAST